MHADMVRHEIEDQAEIVLLQRLAQSFKAGLAAEFRIEPGVIDDVVAMGAALACLQERRGIDVADSQTLQIGADRRGCVEIELRSELQAVGRNGNACRHQRASRFQTTDQGGIGPAVSSPQMAIRAASLGSCINARADRLAFSRRGAPSPMRHWAVTRPSSVTAGAPKAAPASRGMISLCRSDSNSRTSFSRLCPGACSRYLQSSTADLAVEGSSGSGISSPNLA